ncbi:hypothetical protein DF286_12060 [Sphingosinicella humi]|uniref:AAA+ ATPase domain-containing protein n=2 Tax=Allosphingosinicella humi TaxID=2068657 RepID=A0A2U2J5A3_9SPHN|nr:hypothetical protein DF286_12060 [Sphingosinicella humi]
MQAQGQAPNTVSTRIADTRRVERHYGDVDAAFEADGFASILADLAYTAEDNAAGKPNTSRIEIDGDPYKSLASYRSALSIYRQFRESEGAQTQADEIRQFVMREYAELARRAGQPRFSVRAGDVHGQMGLSNAMPAVCSAIGSGKFQNLAGVRQVGREGPAISSTVTFTFEFQSRGAFDVSVAEAVLRGRYGAPEVDNQKMISFILSDSRAIALQRDIQLVQLWLEDDGNAAPPPAQQVQSYAADQGRHSNLPGRLSHDPPAELRSQGFPKPVLSVRAGSEPELNNILDWYEAGSDGLNRAALERLKQNFLAQYPDFEPEAFRATSGGYWDEERSYKEDLLARARAALQEDPPLSDEQLGGRLLDALTGDGSKLWGWRTNAHFQSVREQHPGALEAAAGRLARSEDELPVAISRFVEEIWPIISDETNRPYSDSRCLPTMIAGLVWPDRAYGINTSPVNRTAQYLTGERMYGYQPLSTEEYRATLELMTAIRNVMDKEWGWAPRDFWDVQGFVWAVNRSDIAGQSDNDEQTGGAQPVSNGATNLILYGPPGTGKTYRTTTEAVRLCDGSAPGSWEEAKARYEELVEAGQIRFVTFHQSYSYEDFVEGLRPVTGEGASGSEADTQGAGTGFRLEPKRGIFREISALAEEARKNAGRSGGFDLTGRQIFKMSLGRSGSEDHIFEAAIEGNYVALGYGGDVDWSDPRYDDYQAIFDRWNEIEPGTHGGSGNISQVWRFRCSMCEGDIVVVSEGNSRFRAIGEIVGPYRFDATGERDYNHLRAVRWLLVPDESLPVETIYSKNFTMQSCYLLKDNLVKKEALARLLPGGEDVRPARPDQFVLIIDEINRANISKVFGELITLLEPDKRIGARNPIRLKLPYSGDMFAVPNNLHIIGTMNTADRSIALLDTALRRRFSFKELMPDPEVLKDASDVTGIDLVALLRTLNQRIEFLFDREHQIGHAYFMHCRTAGDVDDVMRDKVIPLLQEYFYEDWNKVALVLGDADGSENFLRRDTLKSPNGLTADAFTEDWYRWSVKHEFGPSAYAQFG